MAVKGPLSRVQHKLQVLLHKGLAVLKGALVHGLPPGIGHLHAHIATMLTGSASKATLAALPKKTILVQAKQKPKRLLTLM